MLGYIIFALGPIRITHIFVIILQRRQKSQILADEIKIQPLQVISIHDILDWIIQSQLLSDSDWIVLPRLSIDCSQFRRAEITVDFMNFVCNLSTKTTLFQTYFLTSSQINSKNYHFRTVYCAQTDKVESIWKLCHQFERRKSHENYQFCTWLTWSKEVGRK